jgi:hypothetical protein
LYCRFPIRKKEPVILIQLLALSHFIPASNEPSGCEADIWLMPQGSNTPLLAAGYLTRFVFPGYWTWNFQDKPVISGSLQIACGIARASSPSSF